MAATHQQQAPNEYEVMQPLFIDRFDNEAEILRLVAEALMIMMIGEEENNVFNVVRQRSVVTHLELGSPNATGDLSLRSALALHDAFRVNNTIQELQIFDLSDHLSMLLEGVAASFSIKKLKLLRCNISPRDFLHFSNLQALYFSERRLDNEAVTALAHALKPGGSLNRLEDLGLYRCGMDCARVTEIAAALRSNTCMRTLDLSYNLIGDEGAIALSNALLTNKTLTTLRLSLTTVGDNGAVALAGMLKTNTFIEALILTQALITVRGNSALLDASYYNLSLVELQVENASTADKRHRQTLEHNLGINRFRKLYLEQDRTIIAPAMYPFIFARVSEKPSALFLFLQENREMLIRHLPDPSGW
jgi:hypothetical protein